MEKLSISYFRELLAKHIKELKEYCRDWENVSADEILPEEVSDEIRTTIGLTNLLMRQKMKQFGELINDSELKRGEKEITCTDLQGFWDMVYNEVEKIQKSFRKLEKCRENDWTFVQESINKTEPKKKSKFVGTVKLAVAAKGHTSAARQRLAEAKLKMKQAQLSKNNGFEVEVIIAGKNNLHTPLNSKNEKRDESKEAIGEQAECTTMANLRISEPKALKEGNSIKSSNTISTPNELIKGKRKDIKSTKKTSNRKNKENLLLTPGDNFATSLPNTPVEKASDVPGSHSKRKKDKVVPLQCITRSAKKALLAKENVSRE